ncbi:MAG: R3H domain-containing nucleic acid-binding protein [Candidatus Moraniibacteriota bacterium]
MSEQQSSETILKNLAEGLIAKLGFVGSVRVSQKEDSLPPVWQIDITLPEGQHFLIGQHGMNLGALQHLIKILGRRALAEEGTLLVDVNNYFAEKRSFLEREAYQAAEEALKTGFAVTLKPMQPFERKIVHTALASNTAVITESVGKGDERRVLVRRREEEATESE